ncbi:hypothetical protein [Lichenicola sp.]|uniref:hypothetical protein n=1 Tax=Lichenicola sp. TaxID=2804529 RepID=UPI003AFFEB2E
MAPLQLIPTVLASGAASAVEFIEALTVVLALGAARNWRSALTGAAAAILLLALLLATFGSLLRHLPIAPAQFVLGLLLLLFGTRWLRKSTRRSAGLIPMRDETAALQRHETRFAAMARGPGPWDAPALAIAFQATAFEGLEVVFIVGAIGETGPAAMRAAVLGAVAAFLLVCVIGLILRGPITRVPENALKRLLGAMLSGLGTFWIGEGCGLAWPGGDLAVLWLGLAFLLVSALGVARLAGATPAGRG